jgi:hypothetical protein
MITVLKGTNMFQSGDFSGHKDFNPEIHKVYKSVNDFKKSIDYPVNKGVSTFSEEEINKIKNPNSFCNDDSNWK